MIKVFTNDFGFEKIEVLTERDGRVCITNYKEESQDSDIGGVSIMNSKGLGGSEYIRNLKDIDNHISKINRIIWVSDEEKKQLIKFLNNMKY